MAFIETLLLAILLGALAALVVTQGKSIPWVHIALWVVIGTVFLLWVTVYSNGCYCHTCVVARRLIAIPGVMAYLLAAWLLWKQARVKK